MPKNKQATSVEFEKSFFDLAQQQLSEKLARVQKYLVGFEIVEKDEENATAFTALGVFGFRADNGQILYVPVFFKNGEIRGMDIFYSKQNKQFYPLNEDFVEYFLSDDPTGIGGVSDEKVNKLRASVLQPNYRDMVVPPRTGKTSFASVLEDLAVPPSDNVKTDLLTFVKNADNKIKTRFKSLLEKDANYLESVLRFYPLKKIAEAVTLIEPKLDVKKQKVAFYTLDKITKPELQKLSETQKKALIEDGMLVVDEREEKEKSTFGEEKYVEKFQTPTESGFYQYFTASGSLHYGLILTNLKVFNGFTNDKTIVVDMKNNFAFYEQRDNVVVKDKYCVGDFSELYKDFISPAELKPDNHKIYVLVDEKLNCTQPFRVVASFKDSAGLRKLIVDTDVVCGEYISEKSQITLGFIKSKNGLITCNGNTCFVSQNYKALELVIHLPYDEEYKKLPTAPGKKHKIMSALNSCGMFPMTVNCNGSEYFVSVGGVKQKFEDALEAKKAMVVGYGLSKEAAFNLIDSLNYNGAKKSGLYKSAAMGEFVHSLQQPPEGVEQFGQIAQYPFESTVVAPTSDGYTGNPAQPGLGTSAGPSLEGIQPQRTSLEDYVQQAMQLAQAGQKQIFDTHGIAALSKAESMATKVNAYLPSFLACLDKVARMLFLLHWKTDKFEEMYGRSDLPELAELLASVLKNLGDVVVFLKKKSPELSINTSTNEIV